MSTTIVIGPSTVIGTKPEAVKYVDRSAVSLIIQNDKSEVIIIHVSKGRNYKLPGGGVEVDEDHVLAAHREAMEETGCKVQLDEKCIATIEEWRNDLHQISYYSTTKLVKDIGASALTDEETAEGLRHEWVPVKSALPKMKEILPTSELVASSRNVICSFWRAFSNSAES